MSGYGGPVAEREEPGAESRYGKTELMLVGRAAACHGTVLLTFDGAQLLMNDSYEIANLVGSP